MSNLKTAKAMDLVLEIFKDRVEHYAEIHPKWEEIRPDVVFWLQTIQFDRRLWSLNDENAGVLWEEIRKSEALTEIVMSSVIEFRLKATASYDQWVELLNDLSTSYGCFAREGIILDEDTHERASTPAVLLELFKQNTWLVFVLLLSISGLRVS